MNQPCSNRIVCPGPIQTLEADDPIINFSSEAVDGVNFTQLAWPIVDFTNPFTPDDPNNPPSSCDSPISQQEAELCSLRTAFTDQAARNGFTGHIFSSQAQTCGFNCPDGTAFFFTVPPGAFVAFDQNTANQKAAAYACQQVGLNAVCIFVGSTSICKGQPFLSVVTVDGGFAPYSIKIVAGTLPPGIGFVQDTNTTGFFSGVSTTPGVFPVAISARDTHGNIMVRTVTLAVLAISNSDSIPTPAVGTFYNFQLTGAGGTAPYRFAGGAGLPPGLVLQSDGFIVGNPVAPIGTGFIATVTDAAGNSCSFALTYSACSFFKNLVWDNPVDVFIPPTFPNTGSISISFPAPNSIRAIATCTMVAILQPLVWQNTNLNSPLTVPAGTTACKLTINVRSSSGLTASQVQVANGNFTAVYFDTGNVISAPTGSTTYSFNIPNGVTQLAVNLALTVGTAPPPTSGAIDIQVDFGV